MCCRTQKLRVCYCFSWRLEAAGQALKAALAGLSAEPTAAESGDAAVEAALVILLLLLGRGGLALGRVVHGLLAGRGVTLGRVAALRRRGGAVVGLLLRRVSRHVD